MRLWATLLLGIVLAAAADAADELERGQWKSKQRARLERILRHNIIPWWIKHTPDYEYGGFRLNHADNNTYLGPEKKYVLTQARVVWFYSLLCSYPQYHDQANEDMARHGFAFLRDKMWDQVYGGFHMHVSNEGAPPPANETDKYINTQAYALYGLSQYALAFRDEQALGMARELFELLVNNTYDHSTKGFHEHVYANWTRDDNRNKSMDAHMHMVESFTLYYKASKDPRAAVVLQEMLDPLMGAVVDTEHGYILEGFGYDWSYSTEGNKVVFGHINEFLWLVIEALETLGMKPDMYADTYRKIWAFTKKYGYDNKGSYAFSMPASLDPVGVDPNRQWWVMAESLNAAIKLHRVLGDEQYARDFDQILDYIGTTLVDWRHGEWHANIFLGVPGGLKAGPWKGPYHTGRCMVVCIDELSR